MEEKLSKKSKSKGVEGHQCSCWEKNSAYRWIKAGLMLRETGKFCFFYMNTHNQKMKVGVGALPTRSPVHHVRNVTFSAVRRRKSATSYVFVSSFNLLLFSL